jgi:signal transduction histidine kinase/AraC-like DNA-binding protein
MSARYRIALQVGMFDPYWVQVREAVLRHAPQYGVDLVSLNIDAVSDLADDEADSIFAELVVQNVQALIANTIALNLLDRVNTHGIPVIDASESPYQRPLFSSRRGLYDAAFSVGQWLYARIRRPAHVLIVGGHDQLGTSRVTGFKDAFDHDPLIHFVHVPCAWRYDEAVDAMQAWVAHGQVPHFDAIFGISDPQTFAGRDVLREHQLLPANVLIASINGDPLALADISRGQMDMTVETSMDGLAKQMLELAVFGITQQRLPTTYDPPRRIIDRDNVAQIALEKLISLSDLPNRLVGVNRQIEQQRLRQLETSIAITQRVGSILDHDQLLTEVTQLIKTNYGYNRVLIWQSNEHHQLRDRAKLTDSDAAPLLAALHDQTAIFIPDTTLSRRFPLASSYPDTRTRVVLPIRSNAVIVGVLDVHSTDLVPHSRGEIDGLQLVADQIGIAMQNIDLYQAAKVAQREAERADQLKTRLLANVSHELRTPLHIILGYSQLLLSAQQSGAHALDRETQSDIVTIQRSADHLIHLINDLLDLSRAEIDELVLYPTLTNIQALIHELYASLRDTHQTAHVQWYLQCDETLPYAYVDHTRIRQALTNILSNAAKFTQTGSITLGARAEPPYIHIWVRDTGIGISEAQKETIFEAFVTSENPLFRQRGGVGLGLAITRRLVALHHGILTVESVPSQGSTFHLYLPLRGLEGEPVAQSDSQLPAALFVIESTDALTATCVALAQRMRATTVVINDVATLQQAINQYTPQALVWQGAGIAHEAEHLLTHIQTHPQLSRVPFLLYATAEAPILQKPFHNQQFVDIVKLIVHEHHHQPHHVVIVDDDIGMQGWYHDVLTQSLGTVNIIACSDGLQAQHQLQTLTPSFIILDLLMPNQDGFSTLAWIRSQTHLQHVPVLIISGKVLTRDELQQLQYPHTVVRPKIGSDNESLAALFRQTAHTGIQAPMHISALARQALVYIQANYARRIAREHIALAVGVSESYLTQVFQQEMGMTPWVYLTRYRIAQAGKLLRETIMSITDIAVAVGFEDPSYFSKVFRNETGTSPRAYRQNPRSDHPLLQ